MGDAPPIYLVTGIMAAGKSTVAQALAERLPRSVHLRGDSFRKFIVNGRAEMTLELSTEARAQLDLRHELAASTACRYAEAGFAVVLQDVILGADLAAMVRRITARPLHVVVLAPAAAAVEAREAARAKSGYGSMTPAQFDAAFRAETPAIGLWLDTTTLTVAETVDQILSQPERSLVE
ncbi:MAG: AAA family ATPase [Ilumatobacteraceae bacterium]